MCKWKSPKIWHTLDELKYKYSLLFNDLGFDESILKLLVDRHMLILNRSDNKYLEESFELILQHRKYCLEIMSGMYNLEQLIAIAPSYCKSIAEKHFSQKNNIKTCSEIVEIQDKVGIVHYNLINLGKFVKHNLIIGETTNKGTTNICYPSYIDFLNLVDAISDRNRHISS